MLLSIAKKSFINEYIFVDENPNEGLNYYKIESVDIDGKMESSEIRFLNFGNQKMDNIRLYPNPASDYVMVLSNSLSQIKIFNQLGQIIYQKNNPANQQKINTKPIIKGIYFVECISLKGEKIIKKLIINNW